MKRNILATLAILATTGLIIKSSYSKDDGIAGRTTAPGEQTCLPSCHTGNVLNATGGSITVTCPTMPGWAYTPGQTYLVEVTVARTGVNLYGFALEALTANGTNAGSFIHVNPTETWTKSATVSGVSRNAATHKLNGGIGTGTKTFSINWVAPATNVGPVTFYVCGNAANGNGTASGDFIYTKTQPLTVSTASISSPDEVLNGVNVFPNPAASLFNVSFNTTEKEPVKVEVYNISGQFQELLLNTEEQPGKHTYTFDVQKRYAAGLYLLKVAAGNKISYKKVYFQ